MRLEFLLLKFLSSNGAKKLIIFFRLASSPSMMRPSIIFTQTHFMCFDHLRSQHQQATIKIIKNKTFEANFEIYFLALYEAEKWQSQSDLNCIETKQKRRGCGRFASIMRNLWREVLLDFMRGNMSTRNCSNKSLKTLLKNVAPPAKLSRFLCN